MNWPLVKLGDLSEVIMGQAPPSGDCNKSAVGIPFVKAGEFGIEKPIIREWTTNPLKFAKVNDVLLCVVGATCGKINKGVNCAIGRSVAAIRADERKLDKDYMYYFLSSWTMRLRAMSQGAAQTVISKEMIECLEIPLPPLAEQKRIAAILDKADAIRRKRQQAIKLADEFLRSVFLDMFGDLSGFEGAKVKFGDVVSLDAKMVDPTERDYIDLIHIGPDRIEKETGRLLPALTAREEGLISQKFLFDESYVLYSKIRPYLKKCALAKGIGLCSADMYPIRPIEGKVTREFVWMLLLSNTFSRFTETLPDRASIPKLNRAELASFEFELPHYSMQIKFSNIVKSVSDFQAKGLHGEESKESLFSVLSQKAFSGQL